MKKDRKTEKRGGAREGGGRKKLFRVSKKITFVIGDLALEIISKEQEKSTFVNEAIVEKAEREAEEDLC